MNDISKHFMLLHNKQPAGHMIGRLLIVLAILAAGLVYLTRNKIRCEKV